MAALSAGEARHPQDLLGAKRLLAEFKRIGSTTKRNTEVADGQGIAFAERGKRTELIPACHGCDRKCKGGWHKCKHITEDHMSKVAELHAARHFQKKNNNSNNNIGTVNVAAGKGNEDNNSGGNNATKATASEPSKLTEGTRGPYLAYIELLKIMGHMHTEMGMSRADVDIYEALW